MKLRIFLILALGIGLEASANQEYGFQIKCLTPNNTTSDYRRVVPSPPWRTTMYWNDLKKVAETMKHLCPFPQTPYVRQAGDMILHSRWKNPRQSIKIVGAKSSENSRLRSGSDRVEISTPTAN
jgi:hypothetical protein